jgi:acyl-CoA synthetase (AMP-forming)/AMP-acid ligase II
VASIEVEKAIYSTDPRVAEVAVVGLPHAHWSEAITAVVVPRPGETVDPAELREALSARLDRYKIPKAIIVAAELPKTSTGKIQKNVLRDRFAEYYDDQPPR